MAALNKVFLLGHLTRDPELRSTQSGTAVCKFGMAVNRKFKDKEETCFVDLTAWGSLAELISERTLKGSPLLVVGRLDYSAWEHEGAKRSKLSVVVEEVQLMGKKVVEPEEAGEPDYGGIPF